MSFDISVKRFRAEIDKVQDLRDGALLKTAYLCASRNSEICSQVAPWDLLHNKSKPYGIFLKRELKNFEMKPATENTEAVIEKVLVITSAVAKRGKRLKKKTQDDKEIEQPLTEVTDEEVLQAFTKFNQFDLLDKYQSGELQVDPLMIKLWLGKITLKVIALPTSKQYEPWTSDIIKYMLKNKGKLSFPITRQRLWQLMRKNISGILPRKDIHNVRNPLRHFRISHLIEYYNMEPFELTTYAGWTAKTTFNRMGMMASSNLDHYAHLRWRNYFPKLLKPLATIVS